MKEAKFKVGDWAKVKVPEEFEKSGLTPIAHILEVLQQTCEAGIEQTTYIVRLWSDSLAKRSCSNEMRMREIELGDKVEKRAKP